MPSLTFPATIQRLRRAARAVHGDRMPSRLVFVHVGKCGGASLAAALENSQRLKDAFRSIERVHIRQPSIAPDAQYLFAIRNPISRALSAFNWRRKLVVEDRTQATRFPAEAQVLKRFRTFNDLAEALYTPAGLDRQVANDFRRIHHLREDVSFYLSDLLAGLAPNQIFGVIATEAFDADVERVLGVAKTENIHSNRKTQRASSLYLSAQAQQNLRQYLRADFAALERLNALHPLDPRTFQAVMDAQPYAQRADAAA